MTSKEIDGGKLVAEFKAAHPDAYARWFLLEAIGLGIEPICDQLNEFIWARFGRVAPMDSGGMAMRNIVGTAAQAFLTELAPGLERWQRLDVKRRMEQVIAD